MFGMLVFFTNLSFCGISGQIFDLISSFLSNMRLWVLLDGKSSQEYAVNAGVPHGPILGLTLFQLYINDLPDDTTFYFKRDQASDLWQQLELASELESHLRETLCTGARGGLLISMLGKLNWVRLTSLRTLVLLM